MKVKDIYGTRGLESYVRDWHTAYHQVYLDKGLDISKDDMYCNAQFDDIPYANWDENIDVSDMFPKAKE